MIGIIPFSMNYREICPGFERPSLETGIESNDLSEPCFKWTEVFRSGSPLIDQFQDARGAHPAPDAQGDHPELDLSPPHLAEQRRRQLRTGTA